MLVEVSNVIPGPMWPRLGNLPNGGNKGVVLGGGLNLRDDLHCGALRQLCLRRKYHHSVPDCAFVAHTLYLLDTRSAIKPPPAVAQGLHSTYI